MNQELKDKIAAACRKYSGWANDDNQLIEAVIQSIDEWVAFKLQEIREPEVPGPDNKPALPVVGSYGQYSSDNYGRNTLLLCIGDIQLYYSYKTIVAYRDWVDGLVVSVNDWGVTTGKHLNWIQPDHSRRADNFDERLAAALLRHGIKES